MQVRIRQQHSRLAHSPVLCGQSLTRSTSCKRATVCKKMALSRNSSSSNSYLALHGLSSGKGMHGPAP